MYRRHWLCALAVLRLVVGYKIRSERFCLGSRASADVFSEQGLPLFTRESCSVFTLWGLWDNVTLSNGKKERLCRAKRELGCASASYWTGTAIETLVKQYPRLQEIWCNLPWISRADMGRYLVMHAHGGVYMDVDVKITGPLPAGNWSLNLITEHDMVISRLMGKDLILGPREKQYCQRPAQWILASGGPHHKFWERVIDLGIERASILFSEGKFGSAWSVSDVLWACGPDVVVTAYNEQFADVPSVSLVPKVNAYASNSRFGVSAWRYNSSTSRQSGCWTRLPGVAAPTVLDCDTAREANSSCSMLGGPMLESADCLAQHVMQTSELHP
mmetsp:Transcript_12916/g.35691  ORF Transcript_12916/g.35691 Transcript_12916/m.35691 type:complete len:330 (-) Transcript_12916:71-1060(-)